MLSVSQFTRKDESFEPSTFYIKSSSQCQNIDIPKVISSFNTCPYYNIRELIVAFLSNFPTKEDIPQPQSLLASKYKSHPQSRQTDDTLALNIHSYRQQKRRHQHLIQCLNFFLNQSNSIRKLQQQCQRQKEQKSRLNHTDLMSNFQQQFSKLKALDLKYKNTMNTLSNFNFYAEYLISAIHEIIKYLDIKNNYEQKNYIQYLEDLKQSLKVLNQFINFHQQQRIRLRHKVKFSGALKQSDKVNIQKNQIQKVKKIYNILYKLVPEIKKIVRQFQPLYGKIRQSYTTFLVLYDKFTQIDQSLQNQGRYIQLIQQQKNRLTNHLKKNHELMVKYQRSSQYINFLDYIKKRGHVMNIFSPSIQTLQHSIKFINQDYDVIFEQICQKKNSYASNQLERQIQYFKEAGQDGYNTIILNFLRRLLQI